MKNLLMLMLFIFSLGLYTTPAQLQNIYENPRYGADSTSRMECANNLSTMSEYMKIDLYSYALPSWQKVLANCPESSKNIYLYGIKIYRDKLSNAKDPDIKAQALDTLMLIYDMRIEYFGQEGMVLGRKGLDLFRYDRKQIEVSYEMMKKSVIISKEKSEASVMVTLMQIANALFKAGKIEGPELVDNYLLTTEILEQRSHSPRATGQTARALGNIEAIFAKSGAADCETLVEIFGPNFEKTPDNLEFLKKLTTLLINQNCDDTELFANTSENLYKLEPSSQAAYNLAKLFFKKQDFDKSVSYYKEAIGIEEDLIKKAKYQYELGLITYTKYNDFIEARTLARNAIKNNPEWGQPYMLIGNLYASSSKICGDNEFEKTTIFWAAVDKYKQAKSVDESINGAATEQIIKYSQYFPNVEDAFFYGFADGEPYTVGCWINEKTTVRSRQRP